MSEKKKNLIAVVLAAVILGGALLFTFHPELNLRNAILGLVKLPSKVFSYLMPKEEPVEVPVTMPDELPELPKGDTFGEQEVNETPLLIFDEEDGENEATGEETLPVEVNPDAPDIDILPADHLN